MKKMTVWALVFLCSSHLAYAQMYDPFRKTAKPAAVSSTLGLLPPPPVLIPSTPMIVVSAVMNNRAFINGAWLRVGDKVNNQVITYINNNFVGLKEGNRLTMISVGSNRRVLGTKDVP